MQYALYTFSMVYQYISANLCHRSAILIDQCWKTGSYSSKIMLAPPVSAICHVTFLCGTSVQTSVVGVQYCTGSYLSVTLVDQVGKQLDVKFYYVVFTLSQGSLH